MCRIVCDGHCTPASSTGVVDVGGAVARGGWWLTHKVIGPGLLIAAVLTVRWLSGAPLIPGARPWRRPRAVVRVRWHAWPRWQRALTRTVFTVLLIAAVLYPVTTALAFASAAVSVAAAAAVHDRRRPAQRAATPVKVHAVVTRRGQPAIEAQPVPASDLWYADTRATDRS